MLEVLDSYFFSCRRPYVVSLEPGQEMNKMISYEPNTLPPKSKRVQTG